MSLSRAFRLWPMEREPSAQLGGPDQVQHFDDGRGGIPALVPRLRAGPLDALLDGIDGQDAESAGDPLVPRDLGDAFGHLGAQKIKVGRTAPDERSETDEPC